MKPANQNEIDVLLRALARRDREVVSPQTGADISPEHLDADELNAFAEGMVTERARARYSAHLADCENCRGLVVSLTQSAGLAKPLAASERQPTVSFWHQLTAFLSHPVLRFALPAVVLMSIVGIGVIVLRQDEPGEFVAQHDSSEQKPNVDQANQVVPSQSPPTPAAVATTVPGATPAAAVPPVVKAPLEGRRGETADSVAGVGSTEGPALLRKEPATRAEATPTFAPDVTAQAPPPPMPSYAERDRGQTLARDEAPKREAQVEKAAESTAPTTGSVEDRRKLAGARTAANQQEQNVHGVLRGRRDDEH